MSQDDSKPKLHIDSDWKAEAQAEKERLSEKEQKAQGQSSEGERGLPEPNFQALMSILASQAIMGLGAYADPKTNRPVIDLEGAKFSIDLLEVLEEKTKGNLSEQEASDMKQLIAELQNRFVQISQMITQQQASGAGVGQSQDAGPKQPPIQP